MPRVDPVARAAWEKEYNARPERAEARKIRSRMWRLAHPERYARMVRSATLRKKYGISIEDYEIMYAQQDGKCFICNERESIRQNLSVDHDHAKVGRVRSLLCHHCNAALGYAKESPSLLRAMAEYLEAFV